MKFLVIGLMSLLLVSSFPPRDANDELLIIEGVKCPSPVNSIVKLYYGQNNIPSRVDYLLLDDTLFAVVVISKPDRNDIKVFVLEPNGTVTKYNSAVDARKVTPCDAAAKIITGRI